MHESLFDLVHYGRFEYFAVYEMPVMLRSFYLGKLVNVKEKEKESIEKASSNATEAPSSKMARGPDISTRR